MQTCQKYSNSRAPVLESSEEFEVFNKKAWDFEDNVFPGGAWWMSVSDVEEDGVWRDWYTTEISNATTLTRSDLGRFVDTDPTPYARMAPLRLLSYNHPNTLCGVCS